MAKDNDWGETNSIEVGHQEGQSLSLLKASTGTDSFSHLPAPKSAISSRSLFLEHLYLEHIFRISFPLKVVATTSCARAPFCFFLPPSYFSLSHTPIFLLEASNHPRPFPIHRMYVCRLTIVNETHHCWPSSGYALGCLCC